MRALTILCLSTITILFAQSLSAQPGMINVGISAGGSGLAGAQIQIRTNEKIAADFGIYGRLAHVDVFEPRWIFGSAMDVGLSFYIRQKSKNTKSFQDGFYLKGAKGLGELEEVMAGLGWTRELYLTKYPKMFFQFQLGPSIIQRTETYINTRYPPGNQEQSETWITGMIYARLSCFFVAK